MRVFCIVNTDDEYEHDNLIAVRSNIYDSWIYANSYVDLLNNGAMKWNGYCGLRVIETDTDDSEIFIYHNSID